MLLDFPVSAGTGSLRIAAAASGKRPVAAVEPHAAVVALGHDAVAVVLDLVNPSGSRRRPRGRAGQARFYALQLTL